MSNLSRGIMLEGISCAGKTSTMYAIKQLFSTNLNLERNIIMLGEHYTQVLNSINGQFIHHDQDEHTKVLLERIEMLEKLHGWASYLGDFNKRSRGLYTVFERCFLNHIAYYNDYDNPEIINIEKRFDELGIEVILLIISDSNIEKRIISREPIMGDKSNITQLKKRVEQSKESQDKLLKFIKKISLPSRIINTDDMEWKQYAEGIVGIS